jgi:hypothetical protein
VSSRPTSRLVGMKKTLVFYLGNLQQRPIYCLPHREIQPWQLVHYPRERALPFGGGSARRTVCQFLNWALIGRKFFNFICRWISLLTCVASRQVPLRSDVRRTSHLHICPLPYLDSYGRPYSDLETSQSRITYSTYQDIVPDFRKYLTRIFFQYLRTFRRVLFYWAYLFFNSS